jgi:signal transduction histidine kinase
MRRGPLPARQAAAPCIKGAWMADQSPEVILPFDTLLPGDFAANTVRLIRTRWVAGVTVVLATAFCVHLLGLPLPEMPLYVLGAVILAYNLLLTALMRGQTGAVDEAHLRRVRWVVVLQVGLDWISMAAFLHFTGGVLSPAIPFLLIHMLMVTILLPGQSPYIYVVMGVLVLALIAGLEFWQVLPHYDVIPALPGTIYRNATFVVSQLIFFAITALATVYLTSSIMARLRERERQIAALFQTTQAVSSTLSLPEVMEHLARSAALALGVPSASIRLLDESGERLAMTTAYGLSQDYIDKGPVELTHSELDQEALGGTPVIIGEPASDPRIQYPKQVAEEGIRSMLVAPIISGGRPLGVLRVYAGESNHFTAEDASFLMAIARQGAAALENALAHDALQKADRTRGQFVRLVTHELRAPAGGAQSLLRTLLRGLAGELNGRQRDIVQRVERRLDSLMELINDLLALSASKTPELLEDPERLPLQPILEQVCTRWQPQAAEKSIALNVDLPFETLSVTATEEGLVRIFDNLIGNAVKYTPEGGRVDVRAVERPAGAVITVTDTGIGIPEKDITCLWDEFFRASNARKSNIPGTGLGLSIVKQLVELYGGVVGVRSEVGKGTTFKVTLPLSGAGD